MPGKPFNAGRDEIQQMIAQDEADLENALAERSRINGQKEILNAQSAAVEQTIESLRVSIFRKKKRLISDHAEPDERSGTPERLAFPHLAIESLGLRPEFETVLGYKGIGFRMVSQLKMTAGGNSAIIYRAVLEYFKYIKTLRLRDTQQVYGRELSEAEQSAFALDLIQELQHKMREVHESELDLPDVVS